MIYDVDKETLPREDMEALQLRRLKALVEKLYAVVPFYRKAMDARKVGPADLRTLADLQYFPFTEKQDLRNHYPFGLFAAPRESIVRIHSSSGTTGKATVVGYTQRDLDTWAQCVARALMAAGATRNDIIHNAYGYGLFTGGLGAHYGAERLGATVVPVSGGATKRQISILKDFEATVICCTPSYMLHLQEAAEEVGVDIRKLPLRVGVFGAEPWTEEMRRQIEQKCGITATNIYGLSEIMGPGVAQECAEGQCGMHLFEDHFYPEIINPESGEVLPPGAQGELVITTLTKEGIPLLRYRTRDMTTLNYTPCICGRTLVRMGRIAGRSDDMLIIRGVNVFPSQIESILMETEGLSPHYQIVVRREGTLDTMEVQVEVGESMFSDEIKTLQQRERRISETIKEFLGVTAKVKLVERQSIARSEGKAKRVIDERSLT
ncbi:phenylacetate--CoA ligase family protein [Megalodesulfovibrio paquesii]